MIEDAASTTSTAEKSRLVAGRLLHEAMHINEKYSRTIHVSYPIKVT